MIKVLFIGISDVFGGIERFIMNFCKEYDASEFEIGAIAYSDNYVEKEFFKEKNVKVYMPEEDISKIISLYDIIHINKNSALITKNLSIAKKLNKKVIWHSHNTGISMHNNIPGLKFIHYLKRNGVVRKADVLLSCSDKAAEWMYGKHPYVFLPNGVDLKEFTFSDEVRSNPVYGTVCRFTKQKNLIFLISIFKSIHLKNETIRFLMVGDGPEMENVRNEIKKEKMDDFITLTGYVDNPREYYSKMDAVVMPSLYEGFPMSIVEAQALGCMVFASDTITRQVTVTDAVHFFDIKKSTDEIADGILSEMKSPISRNDIRTKFSESLFTTEKSYELLSKLYKDLVKK